MKKSYIYIICILTAALAACSGRGSADRPASGAADTVYSEQAVLSVYGSDPQRALTMIDSGVLVGTLEPDLATLLRATVYCNSSDEWPIDTACQLLEGLLETDLVAQNPSYHQNVLDLLINVSRRRSDNVSYLRWATEKADFCRQQDQETEALRTEAEIGAVLTLMGDVEKGLAKLDGVIATLDNRRHFNEMDACIIALKRKIYVLFEVERPDEVIPLAKRMVAKLNDYREHPDDYDDGSFRMPPDEEKRLGYCEFYTSQAYSYLTIAYGDMSSQPTDNSTPHSSQPTKFLDSSRYYLSLFENTDYAKTFNGRMMLSSAYLRLGQYGKVLPIYDEVEARMGDDTVNGNYATNLKGRAIIAEAMGNYRAATSYLKRYGNLKEILHKQLLESRAHEYAARYHLQEEEMESERLKERSERIWIIAIVATAFAILVVLSCVWLGFSRRAISRKNKVLAEQLADITRRGVTPCTPENDALGIHGGTPLPEPSDSHAFTPSDINALTDEQLFKYLSDVIRREKLFLDNNFGRETLMERFHLTDRRIGAAFTKGSKSGSEAGGQSDGQKGYASISDFIRELRLEYACQLLTESPDMTISDIAATSGFGSPIVFNRAFKAKYEITPTYYREQMNGAST